MALIGKKINYKEAPDYCGKGLKKSGEGLALRDLQARRSFNRKDIAEKLGFSRVPVREALMNLDRWGFVKEPERNHKGREVVALTRKEIREFYQMLVFIEISAFSDCSLSDNQTLYINLMELIDKMDKVVSSKNMERYRELNSSFHHEIVKGTNNRRLYKMYCDISRWSNGFKTLLFTCPGWSNRIRNTKR